MTAPDTLETLLNLVVDTVEPGDLVVSNCGDCGQSSWYVLAYWQVLPDGTYATEAVDGFELEAYGKTLREALCNAIAHPRFGQ